MTPEQKARKAIDKDQHQSGWVIQDMKTLNPMASLGVAVREYPMSTVPVDYALFVDGVPVGVIEAKKSEMEQNATTVEEQSVRHTNGTIRWLKAQYRIRFAYEATNKLTRFTDCQGIKYRARAAFSFHRPESFESFLKHPSTIHNNLKQFPPLDTTGYSDCQIKAIDNLDISFANNRPRALVQMATDAGKTFTAITAVHRLPKHAEKSRILFLVDTKRLGEQTECEFLAYRPNDDPRPLSQIYGVYRL